VVMREPLIPQRARRSDSPAASAPWEQREICGGGMARWYGKRDKKCLSISSGGIIDLRGLQYNSLKGIVWRFETSAKDGDRRIGTRTSPLLSPLPQSNPSPPPIQVHLNHCRAAVSQGGGVLLFGQRHFPCLAIFPSARSTWGVRLFGAPLRAGGGILL